MATLSREARSQLNPANAASPLFFYFFIFSAVSPQTPTNRHPTANWRSREEREKYVPPYAVWICLIFFRLSKHLLMWQVDASGALQAEGQRGLVSGPHLVPQPTVSTNIFSITAERHSSPCWPPEVCQASTSRIERCLVLVMLSRDVRYQLSIKNFCYIFMYRYCFFLW